MSRKENALDLAKFVDKGVRVKLSGGREGTQHTEARTLHSNYFCECGLPVESLSVVTVICGAAVQGTLKGYDQLLNLVMDETVEYLRGKQSTHAQAEA